MPVGDWILWLITGASLVTFLSLVYAAWWALFADRANGRRRCPRCWYDMAYSPGMTCGECGFTATSERKFDKTRRRYGIAAAAILASVTLALFINIRLADVGWMSVVPSRVLILALPITQHDGAAMSELNRRMASRRLSTSEIKMLLRRSARGDWWARPPQSATQELWAAKYGANIRRWRGQLVLHDEVSGSDRRRIRPTEAQYNDLEQLLMDIPPLVDLRLPQQWPKTVPLRLQINMQQWWPSGTESRLRITSDHLEETRVVHQRWRGSNAAYAFQLGPIEPDVREMTFTVSTERRRPGLGEPWQHVANHEFTLPIELVDGFDDSLKGVDDEATRRMMTQVFAGAVVSWAEGTAPVRFQYDPSPTLTPAANDLAIGVAVRLKRGDEVARQLNMWWLGGETSHSRLHRGLSLQGLGWELVIDNPQLLAELDADDPRWVVHVQGCREIAAMAGEAKRFWDGSYTLPMRLNAFDSPAGTPEWWEMTESR